MSRFDELKKQYPELNISMFDLFLRMDTSKTYKYLPLLCKIFGRKFDVYKQWNINNKNGELQTKNELINNLSRKGIRVLETDSLSELYSLYMFSDNFANSEYEVIGEFIDRMNKNQIINKDVTSYQTLDSIRSAISLSQLKDVDKSLQSQIIREFEDEKWLILRPLTFQSSSKYGASTRWCTTYKEEKDYFRRYWERGILVYYINKQTGYKFASFKSLDGDKELSFWSPEDNRIDYLDIDVDDYLYPIVKTILKSTKTNKDLCSPDIVNTVLLECSRRSSAYLSTATSIGAPTINQQIIEREEESQEDIQEPIGNSETEPVILDTFGTN